MLHASLHAMWFLSLSDSLNAFSLLDFNFACVSTKAIYKVLGFHRSVLRSFAYKELQMELTVRIS